MDDQRDFVRSLENATLKIIEEVAKNMEKACLVIETDAKKNVPVGNGRKTPWNWGNPGSSKWRGRKNWQGSQPHPFLEPARDANKEKVTKILAGKQR